MTSQAKIQQTITTLKKKRTFSKVINMNQRNKKNLMWFVDLALPDKYKGNDAIQRLVVDLVLGDKHHHQGKDDWVSIGKKVLTNSFKTIYTRQGRGKSDPKDKTIFKQLIEEGFIESNNVWSKTRGVTIWYRIHSEFPLQVKALIMHAYSNNLLELANLGFMDIDNGLSLKHTVARNEIINTPDVYVTSKQINQLKLTGLSQVVLEKGMLGANYLTRNLIINILTDYNINLQTLLTNTKGDYVSQSDHIGGDPKWLLCHTSSLLSPESTVGLELTNINEGLIGDLLKNFGKLLGLLIGTSETCELHKILFHRSPLVLGYTGRIFESEGLGSTGLKSSLKRYSYQQVSEITGIKVHNYDLRASQVSAILHYADLHGYNLPHLSSYVSDKTIRGKLADEVGIRVGLLKTLILIKMFGGDNKYSEYAKASYPVTIMKYGYSQEDVKGIIDRFNNVCQNILAEIDIWFNDLMLISLDHLSLNGLEYSNGVTVVKKSFLAGDKSRQSAYMLQGLEALFILHLINISRMKSYSYYFLSYEFDGLISLGAIPQSAIDEATKLSGFNRAILEEKPI